MFNIGDRVKCIDNSDSGLEHDKIYRILEYFPNENDHVLINIREPLVWLYEKGKGDGYFASRFELVSTHLFEGERIKKGV